MIMAKKGYNYPIKKKKLLIPLLNLFGTIIIPPFLRFVSIFSEILSNYLPRDIKSLPCVKGGGVRSKTEGL